jgi:serine/threonine protein kinase
MEDKEVLIERLQTLPEKEEDQFRLKVLKARLFVDLGQPQVALTCLEDLKPSQGEEELWRLYSMGRANEAIGDAGQASAAFKKVLALNLGFQDVRQRMEALSSTPALREDRYRRQAQAGEDEFGIWYKGYDTALRTPVLLHFLDRLQGSEALANDQAFLRGVVGISHPSVLTLRDVNAASSPPLLIYEDFEGQPLNQWLGEGYKPSSFAAMDKLRQILEALAEANKRGASHLGLTPSSILMDREGRVKIQGLGLRQGLAQAGVQVPPPPDGAYRPPDSGGASDTPPSYDLYSAGVLFLYILTGAPPPLGAGGLTAEELAESLPGELNVPASVQKVLLRMLSVDPKERYAHPEDALREISAQELPPGSVIAGRYEILEELGRGGMGQVFRVRDRDLDEVIALKTLRNRPEMSEASRARFLREIKLTRKITHPNVIRVFDLGAWRDMAFLTMEYIPGKTLSLWVREGEGKRANLRQKVEILRGIAAGLQEAHKLGIIHRDLKPQNVILTPGGIPKLLDFGIAHAQLDEGAELTQEGHFVGSPKYVSPEQIQGISLSVRSDIYCFGLLAYFLLTGQDAFTGDTPLLILLKQLKEQPVLPSRLARLPPSLEALILTCLQKKPEDRPESLEEVVVALKEIV